MSLIAIAAAGGMLETPSDDRRGWEQDELKDCWPWPSTGPLEALLLTCCAQQIALPAAFQSSHFTACRDLGELQCPEVHNLMGSLGFRLSESATVLHGFVVAAFLPSCPGHH